MMRIEHPPPIMPVLDTGILFPASEKDTRVKPAHDEDWDIRIRHARAPALEKDTRVTPAHDESKQR